MAFTKIWVHIVFGTKNRYPYLGNDIKSKLISHIKENAKNKNIFIKNINGYHEHLHCLIALNADMTIAKAVQLIKDESAFWINKQQLIVSKFEWADEYFAISVSESMVEKVSNYINNQEEHHHKTTFEDEYNLFMGKYKFNN